MVPLYMSVVFIQSGMLTVVTVVVLLATGGDVEQRGLTTGVCVAVTSHRHSPIALVWNRVFM